MQIATVHEACTPGGLDNPRSTVTNGDFQRWIVIGAVELGVESPLLEADGSPDLFFMLPGPGKTRKPHLTWLR